MKPAQFEYHRARDLSSTIGLLADLGQAGLDPKLLAGGQSLIPMMAFRLARPGAVVDLGAMHRRGELRGIAADADGSLRIGALVTHHEVETSRKIPAGFSVMRDAMRWVGHLPIRTRGTVGGSLVHGDATAEWCLVALLCDARVVAHGPAGRREIGAADMFHGFYETAVAADEVVTEVKFTRPAPCAALVEFAQRHGDFAIVNAAVALDKGADGALEGGRVVLGGVAPAPIRVPEAESLLVEGPDSFARCADVAADAIDPPSDAHGSSAYRRKLTRSLVLRACQNAWESTTERNAHG